MKALNLYKTEPVDDLAWPNDSGQNEATLKSSALEIFTDFTRVQPPTISATKSALAAAADMRQTHAELNLVMDSHDHLKGIIRLDDLHEQEFMKRVYDGKGREDLLVRDFLTPKEQLKAFSFQELETSSIGDVLETLNSEGQHLCLVVDRTTHKVRGVISADDIARKLRVLLKIQQQPTFANIFQAIKSQTN